MLAAVGSASDPRGAAIAAVRAARRCGASMLSVAHDGVAPPFVAEVHRRGMALWVWTVDGPERMRELAAAGVDGITSNWPDRLIRALEDRPADNP